MSNLLDLSHLDEETRREIQKRVTAQLWERGNLRFKLDATQLEILRTIEGSSQRKFYLLCSRRLGKSYTLLVLCFMQALQQPGSRILWLAPWAKDAADIATDIAQQIMVDCPGHLKPDYRAQSKELIFQNGSVIRFKGTNGEHAQFLRGGATEMVVLDECGLMDDLKHVISDVVMPMTLTTGGRIYLATTPPRSPGHDSAIIYEELAGTGAVAKFTLLDNHRVSDEIKGEFLREAGERPEHIPAILAGRELPRGTTALREYWCSFVTDSSAAVVPEYHAEARAEIVKSSRRPEYFDTYVSMDPGMQDRTGILYAYWDFKRGKLVIEDESLLSQASTFKIAEEITRKEYALWGDKVPLQRVSDVDLRLVADLWERHQLGFTMTEKQDSLGAINLVRNMVQTREIEINPRCVHLDRQLQNAIWNNKATDFARAGSASPDGHFDLVAALKYLCRNVNRHKNPFPAGFRNEPPDRWRTPRSRFWGHNNRLGLLHDTPLARKLTKKPTRG